VDRPVGVVSGTVEARTATGRKVLAIYGDEMLDNVQGIEDEARAAERARLRAAVEVLPTLTREDVRWRGGRPVDVSAVLALLADPS